MFYDSFLSPSNGTFCLHENTDLLRKQTNKQHLFQTFLWKETLKVVAAAAPCAPWPRSHLPQHDLPQHPPSLSGCHVPPQHPTHLPNAAGSTNIEKHSAARRSSHFTPYWVRMQSKYRPYWHCQILLLQRLCCCRGCKDKIISRIHTSKEEGWKKVSFIGTAVTVLPNIKDQKYVVVYC